MSIYVAPGSGEAGGLWGRPRILGPENVRGGLGRTTLYAQTSISRPDIKLVELRAGSPTGTLMGAGAYSGSFGGAQISIDTGYTVRDKDKFYLQDVTNGKPGPTIYIEEIRVSSTNSAQLALLNFREDAGPGFQSWAASQGLTAQDIAALDGPISVDTPPALEWSLSGAINEWRYRAAITGQQQPMPQTAAAVAAQQQQQAAAVAQLAQAQPQSSAYWTDDPPITQVALNPGGIASAAAGATGVSPLVLLGIAAALFYAFKGRN